MLTIQEKLDSIKAGEVGSFVVTNREINDMSVAEWTSFTGILTKKIVAENLYYQEIELPGGILIKWRAIPDAEAS